MVVWFNLTLAVFLGLCLLFALIILIQKGRGGGISAAFGGAGGNTAFGSKTGDVLTWATSIVFFIFLTLCVILNWQATSVDRTWRGHTAASPGASEAADTNAPAPASPVTPATLPATDLPPSATPLPEAAAPATQP